MKKEFQLIILFVLIILVNISTWFYFGKEKLVQKQYENILKYTPFLSDHIWDNIYVLWENDTKVHLPDYDIYHPIIINTVDSIAFDDNNHLIVIDNAFYNPFYNNIEYGSWWLGTDDVSTYKKTYFWFFFDWVSIKSNPEIENHFNELLYIAPVMFGNNAEHMQRKFGKPDSIYSKQVYNGEYQTLIYDGLEMECIIEESGDYTYYSLSKIKITNPEYLKKILFNRGEDLVSLKEYLGNQSLAFENDSTIIYKKQHDSFNYYNENCKLIIRAKNKIIKEIVWQYR